MLHQVLQLLQRLQHRKNQHQHLVPPFLCQAKVTPIVLQMDLSHAPFPASLQRHQHCLRFPMPTLGLMVATLRGIQEVPEPTHLQLMEVIKRVPNPTRVAVAVLLKLCLDHSNSHRLLHLPALRATALKIQMILLVLYPTQMDLAQELVVFLLSRHPQVLLQPATLLYL